MSEQNSSRNSFTINIKSEESRHEGFNLNALIVKLHCDRITSYE